MWADAELEGLRKSARKLEHDIDGKLTYLSKLGATFAASVTSSNMELFDHKRSDQTPLLSSSSSSDNQLRYREIVEEIDSLLAKLTSCNDQMNAWGSKHMNKLAGTPALHTLQRHRDILQDYIHEFNKSKKNIEHYISREELLSSPSSGEGGNLLSNRRIDILTRESDMLANSERLVDEQIDMAMATKENLRYQRSRLGGAFGKLGNIKARFPLVNNLVSKIQGRKKKESLILGCLIGFGVVVILWYNLG